MPSDDHARRAAARTHEITNRIERIKQGRDRVKTLGEERALKAAQHVGAGYKAAFSAMKRPNKTDLRMELWDKMAVFDPKAARRQSDEGFKIHRWMLKNGATELTDALREHHRKRGLPPGQKSLAPANTLRTYVLLVGVLADLAGKSPLDAQAALLQDLDLIDDAEEKLDEDFLPEQRLVERLRDFAGVMARDLDLAGFFQSVEMVQPRLNLRTGRVSLMGAGAISCDTSFRLRSPLDIEGWLEEEAPMVPSVVLARSPSRYLGGRLCLTGPNGETQHEEGYILAAWEIHLAIAPSGPNTVAPYLLRSSHVALHLQSGAYHLPRADEDLVQLSSQTPFTRDGETWTVSSADTPFPEDDPHVDLTELEATLDGIPSLRVAPLTARILRAWLMEPKTLVVNADTFFPQTDLLASDWDRQFGWIRTNCLARSLETALRDGRLSAALAQWMALRRPQLVAMKQIWMADCYAMDAALAEDFKATDLRA